MFLFLHTDVVFVFKDVWFDKLILSISFGVLFQCFCGPHMLLMTLFGTASAQNVGCRRQASNERTWPPTTQGERGHWKIGVFLRNAVLHININYFENIYVCLFEFFMCVFDKFHLYILQYCKLFYILFQFPVRSDVVFHSSDPQV